MDEDWRASMYGSNGDENENREEDNSVKPIATDGRFLTIKQGFHKIKVPTPQYVEQLEHRANVAEQRVISLERRLHRLEQTIRHETMRLGNKIGSIERNSEDVRYR